MGNLIAGCQSNFQRQGSRESIDPSNQQHQHTQQTQLQSTYKHNNGGNQPFYRQTSHENLYPYSSASSSATALGGGGGGGAGGGRLSNNKREIYRPHSREYLGEIHEGPDDGDGALAAPVGGESQVADPPVHPLRRRRVYRSCDNILQQPPNSSAILGGGGVGSGVVPDVGGGRFPEKQFQPSPTRNNRPQILHGIIGKYGGSLGNVVSPSAGGGGGGGGGGGNATSPFARVSSPHNHFNNNNYNPLGLVSPSASKEKLTTKKLPSSENIASNKNNPRYQVAAPAPPAVPPPVPPHGKTPPHDAPGKGAANPSTQRIFQPLTVEINPGL